MKRVSVAKLKNELSRYLREAGAGEEIIVVSHEREIAKVVPLTPRTLITLRPPTRPASELKKVRAVRPLKDFDVVKMLAEDRRRR